ncbi:hypothetical protein K435DRAFT_294961 [Dendrothele bispora CBS 962.96]|uniref:Uncharacterized protein n=1 Tax=Dendrothele bispora (strain CBS 962.96) TaxID=1314807 RepID=A0A4S8MKQ7_DENBC|nr:hypothetical protein K435DRAFT_294961 [Dendrothele bispora CBS 962.96]
MKRKREEKEEMKRERALKRRKAQEEMKREKETKRKEEIEERKRERERARERKKEKQRMQLLDAFSWMKQKLSKPEQHLKSGGSSGVAGRPSVDSMNSTVVVGSRSVPERVRAPTLPLRSSSSSYFHLRPKSNLRTPPRDTSGFIIGRIPSMKRRRSEVFQQVESESDEDREETQRGRLGAAAAGTGTSRGRTSQWQVRKKRKIEYVGMNPHRNFTRTNSLLDTVEVIEISSSSDVDEIGEPGKGGGTVAGVLARKKKRGFGILERGPGLLRRRGKLREFPLIYFPWVLLILAMTTVTKSQWKMNK